MTRVVTLRQQMEEARDQTLHLCACVNDIDFRRQLHREFSPVGWHLGHIGVTEAYWILQQCKGEPTLSAAYDRFFTPTDTPKPAREHLPARDEILAYLRTVRERVLNFLVSADPDSDHPLLRDARIFNMLLQHEEQHQETMSLILRLLAADRYDSSPSPGTGEGWGEGLSQLQPDRRSPHPGSLPREERETALLADDSMTLIPAGSFVMGSNDIARTLDNERPQHMVFVPAFLIDRRPVTNAEFLSFITSGGYHARSCWSAEGWQWRELNTVEHPLYWREQRRDKWIEIGLQKTAPLEPRHPVQCVSWYEAEAYARWIGKRLPTEEEWEKAASWDPERQEKRFSPGGEREPDSHTGNDNAHGGDTTSVDQHPAGRGPSGCEDMLGNVWEWTATWFEPYAGFAAFPYEGYSVPYFDQRHRVLRGGSWATRRHVLRTTFRNWYHPWVREIFAGFRCATDL
jgi:iron(II)-dependent oxidoreductase